MTMQWVAIHASGLAIVGAYQPQMGFDHEDGHAPCLPLTILLCGVEWFGRKLQFRLDRIDTGAFRTATDKMEESAPLHWQLWGYAEWWHPNGWKPECTAMPRWWYNPPTEVVRIRTMKPDDSRTLTNAVGSAHALLHGGLGGMAAGCEQED